MLHNQFLHCIKNLIPGPFHFDGVRELCIDLPLYLQYPNVQPVPRSTPEQRWGIVDLYLQCLSQVFLFVQLPTLVEDPTNYCEPNLFHKCIRARSNAKLERPELPF